MSEEYLGDNTPSCMGSVTTGEMISTGMEMDTDAIVKSINDNMPKKCFVGTLAIDPKTNKTVQGPTLTRYMGSNY